MSCLANCAAYWAALLAMRKSNTVLLLYNNNNKEEEEEEDEWQWVDRTMTYWWRVASRVASRGGRSSARTTRTTQHPTHLQHNHGSVAVLRTCASAAPWPTHADCRYCYTDQHNHQHNTHTIHNTQRSLSINKFNPYISQCKWFAIFCQQFSCYNKFQNLQTFQNQIKSNITLFI